MSPPVNPATAPAPTQPASSRTPAADAAPATPGLPGVPPPAVARVATSRPPPAVDDRVAADLRGRVGAPQWMTDVKLCHDLRTWQQARDHAPAEAAAQLGVPHVTSDTFMRLRSFQRLTGAGSHWPELVAVHVESEATKRATAMVAASAVVSPVATAPAQPSAASSLPPALSTPSLAPLTNVELDRLGCRIEAEMTAKTCGRRTAETAEMLRAAAARARATRTTPMRERSNCKMPGVGSLAYLLADLEVGEKAKPLVRTQARAKWYSRLAAYVPLLTMVDSLARSEAQPAPAAATPAVVVPVASHPTPAAVASKPAIVATTGSVLPGVTAKSALLTFGVDGRAIKGRPVLQDDGRLLVTFETTCAVGPGHGMWDAARAAMNAP